jgi:hypothetical protein
MTLLDGAILLGYLTVFAGLIGSFLGGCAALSTLALGRWSWPRFHHLVQSLIPLAGCGVFLGLSMTTVTLLRHDGFDLNFIGALRAMMLGAAAVWSLWLGFRIAKLYSADASRRLMALLAAVGASGAVWATLFW